MKHIKSDTHDTISSHNLIAQRLQLQTDLMINTTSCGYGTGVNCKISVIPTLCVTVNTVQFIIRLD